MADELTLCLIQMNSAGERDANLEKASRYIDDAVRTERLDLVVLPEFFNIPYVFQYRDYSHIDLAERDDGPTIQRMAAKAIEHQIHIVATIFEEESAGLYYDTAVIIDPNGGVVGKYRKTHPSAVRSLEKIYFRFGSYFPVFLIRGFRVGINICYDTFFPEAARCSAVNGAELIVAPFAAFTEHVWREVMVTRAYENGVFFAPCNKVGEEGEWNFGGRSMIVDPTGAVLAEAGPQDDRIIVARLDRQKVFAARRGKPTFRDRRPDLYGPICAATEYIARVR
jgi:predicted amidohydrolase